MMGGTVSASHLELTGAILAGGHSSRFGSNKALFAPDGETLISKAADLLHPLVREVLVSASHANVEAYAFLGLDIVEDLHPDCGPLGGWKRCSTVVLRRGCSYLRVTCPTSTAIHSGR